MTEGYSAGAIVYQRRWAAGLRGSALELLQHLPIHDAAVVVDLGAGVGALLPDLAEAAPGALVVGADRSEGMISLSPRSFPVAVVDAMKLPLASGSIDVVTMLFMLFHLPDPGVGLTEVRNALRPGGSVGILTWGPEESFPALEMLDGILDGLGAAPHNSLMSNHDLVDSPEKLATLLDGNGLDPVETWTGHLRRDWDVEGLLEIATDMQTATKRRFDTLDRRAQTSFVETARERLSDAASADMHEVSELVFATARRN